MMHLSWYLESAKMKQSDIISENVVCAIFVIIFSAFSHGSLGSKYTALKDAASSFSRSSLSWRAFLATLASISLKQHAGDLGYE